MLSKSIIAVAALAALAIAQEPPTLTALLSNTSQLSNLTTFVQLFPDLLQTLGSATNITILAPSNDAFAKLLATPEGQLLGNNTSLIKPILTYHVLNGTYPSSSITETPAFIPTLLSHASYSNVTGGQVVEAVLSGSNALFFSGLLSNSTADPQLLDVQFTGGLVHVIDTVLTVPLNISTTAIAADLTSAAGALTSADLIEAVDTTPDLTVFIPNNEAFQSIGSALPNLTTEQITSILQYHVVPGVVGYSSSLSNTSLTTLQGNNLTITVGDSGVFVNSAKVVLADVLVANGVVHVIDNVLNPDNATSPTSSATAGAPAFSGASSVSDTPFTSGVPTPTSTIATTPATAAATVTSASGSGSGGAAAPTVSEAGAAKPMITTGAVGVAALFGAGLGLGVWV